MIRSQVAILTSLLAHLPAQAPQAEPTAPKSVNGGARLDQPLASVYAEDVQAILKQWPNTRLGKLLADPDVVDAATTVVQHTRDELRRQRGATAAAEELGEQLELEPWIAASISRGSLINPWSMFRFPVEQVRRAEMLVAMGTDPKIVEPLSACMLSCTERYEGRWSQAFEAEARQLSRSKYLKAIPDTKIGGFPAYAFAANTRPEDGDYIDTSNVGRWQFHMPGTFVFGSGRLSSETKVDVPRPTRPAGIGMSMDLQGYVDRFQRMGIGIPNDFALLGFDSLKTLDWTGRFVGELLQDEFQVELKDAPKGLVGAILTGTAELPAQALPKGAIVQVRGAANLEMLPDIMPMIADEIELPPETLAAIVATFDGGISLGCCSPALGGLIPRVYVSLGLRDGPAVDALLSKLLTDLVPTKKVKYSGIECTIVKIPDVPNGIQPAFCRIGNTLHIAESGRSLRTFLKAQKGGAVAMDVEDAPLPQGEGEPTGSLELRFDEVELYESFYKHWLPLFEMSGASPMPSPIRRDDMPDPETVAEYCGKSQGLLRKQGNTYRLQHIGPLGGPEAAAIVMMWAPMILPELTNYVSEHLAFKLAQHKLLKVGTALQEFRAKNNRSPKDLGELFMSAGLPDDALLMPADSLAEPVSLPNGRTMQTSFRYYPKPARFDGSNGGDNKVVLIEIRPHRYSRAVLLATGSVPDTYGSDCQKSIDQFGKGSPSSGR